MKTMEVEVKHPNAAGIDIGSKSHFVAVGQAEDEVKEFGVSHTSHQEIIRFLRDHGVITVAMESTGSYWQPLFIELTKAGFELLLVPGTQTKGFRKTDVKDARQLQQLHTLGILTSCYLPDDLTGKVRELTRFRTTLIQDSTKYVTKMQKCLRLMNIRLDVLLSDIVGKSGMRIIASILEGNRDPLYLASLADKRVKKTKEELADALLGNYADEYLYELRVCYTLYNHLQDEFKAVDSEIERYFLDYFGSTDLPEGVELTPKRTNRKNQPLFDVQKLSYKMYEVDLSAIKGVSTNTILSVMTEVGTSFHKFPTAKDFASWLGLSPNNKISGGRKISSHIPKGKNPLGIALRNAANVIGNLQDGYLSSFFRKIAVRKGRVAAITATARKLAVIIYNMIVNKQEYDQDKSSDFQQKMEERKIQRAIRLLKNQKFNIIDTEGVIM